MAADDQTRVAATEQGPSWSETILRLRAGEPAPRGYEIKRIIGSVEQMTGPNTNTETIYIVAARSV